MNVSIKLLNLRNEINNIDEKIIDLLTSRKKLSEQIANEKLLYQFPIKDINRENQLLSKLKKLGEKYELDEKYIIKLFEVIIQYSVKIQQKIIHNHNIKKNLNLKKIAYLGPKGSYSYFATHEYCNRYSKQLIHIDFSNFKEILNSVNNKITDYAILPIENTSSGSINDIFDLLQRTNLFIINELYLPINHCLLSNNNIDLNSIKYIYTHVQPLEQCSNFISQFPKWKIKIENSTAAAMKRIADINKNNVAAIGNITGGALYNLTTLKKNIANKKNNTTRFIILSRKNMQKNDINVKYKTTFMIQIKHKHDFLIKILYLLYKQNLFISQIKSRPLLTNENLWEKVFFIDIIYDIQLSAIQKTLKIISALDHSIKILGSYPIDKMSNYKQI